MQSTLDFLRKKLSDIEKELSSIKHPNQQLQLLDSKLKFVKYFPHQGAQSITGIVNINNIPIVFKISLKFDNILELEKTIVESIHPFRKSCPHFMGYVGLLTIPISQEFLEDHEHNYIFEIKENMFPKKVAFYEYINNISMYNICKNMEMNLISSQLLQILLALQYQQQKISFTHYDLHTDNVLIKTCDKNSMFLYILNNKKYAVPTYGFYPVLVDLASSYCDILLNKPMYSSIHYYDQGLQPSCFDKMEDIHHLCMSVASSCERYSKKESHLDKQDKMLCFTNKMRKLFKYLPISNRGWKILKHDFLSVALDNISKKCTNYDRFEIIEDFEEPIISMLSTLIILPFKPYKDNIKIEKYYTGLLEEISKLFIYLDIMTEDHGMFVLRGLFDSIHRILENNANIVSELKNFLTYISSVFPVLKNVIKKVHSHSLVVVDSTHTRLVINFEQIVNNSKMISYYLSDLYFKLLNEHNSYINKCYNKTVINDPLDMFHYISRNFTPNFDVDYNTTIYIWNCDNNSSSIKKCANMKKDEIKKVNSMSFIDKGECLYEILSK